MNFKEKVQSMTAKEIIMAMVEGLRNPKIKVNMAYYGEVQKEYYFFEIFSKDVCYGCAATNTICQISGITFNKSNIVGSIERAKAIGMDLERAFVHDFEWAINSLRTGSVADYNEIASRIKIAQIDHHIHVPMLKTHYTKEELMKYEVLADMQ